MIKQKKMSKLLSQEERIKVFGIPNKLGTPYLTTIDLPYPMKLAWNTKQTVTKVSCHKLLADVFVAIFNDILDAYGLEEIQKLGIDKFGGIFNYRKVRGGSRISTHAFAISIDLHPAKNSLKATHKTALFAQPEYKKMIDIFYKHGFISLGVELDFDWMHFEPGKKILEILKIKEENIIFSENSNTYVVNKSDSLWKISRDNNISIESLKKLNNLKGNLIHPGQILKLK